MRCSALIDIILVFAPKFLLQRIARLGYQQLARMVCDTTERSSFLVAVGPRVDLIPVPDVGFSLRSDAPGALRVPSVKKPTPDANRRRHTSRP